MALATWWRGDTRPALEGTVGLSVVAAHDDHALARLNRIAVDEVRARRRAGHRAYVGLLHGVAVTYGWVATRAAAIGELGLSFAIPPRSRYLWDFATLPEWQGRGLYPRLLQAILEREARDADQIWIIHAPENLPSGAGMSKAGLAPVGVLSFDPDGRVSLRPTSDIVRAAAGARLLGVPLVAEALAPCWHCAGEAARSATGAACWPAGDAAACSCATRPRPSAALELR